MGVRPHPRRLIRGGPRARRGGGWGLSRQAQGSSRRGGLSTMTAYALSFLAGVLTVLSPCVLPLVPVVVASALSQHRLGPVALAAGLVASSSGVGLVLAMLGFGL